MDCHLCLHRWRRWIGFVVVVAYISVLVIALPLCIWEFENEGTASHVEAWFIGGIFVMLALPISFWGILQHVLNYTQPDLQRHIIRILWMVPIYAVNAWFALRFPSAAIYLDTLRECYEAYVIYNFMAYLLSFLHNEYPHLAVQVENKPPVKHLFPLCWFPPCHNGGPFIQRCKHGVLQYTVVRPAMTVIAMICEMSGKYDEGDFNFTSAWSYIVLINNMSQILAMYCLVMFYKAFKEELQPLKPLPKFLCVKAVVFLSFWQALLIAIFVKLNVIPQNGTWVFYKNIHEVATGIQDFLICIEMFLAAIAHYYSFSHKPYVNLAAEQQNCCTSFLSMWNVSDVTDDVVEHARYISRGVNKRFKRDWRGNGERTPLLVDSARNRVQRENMQNRATPSPAVVLENEEARSFEFDYNSSTEQSDHRFHSFVNKSTSLSMNNYAEFSDDTSKGSRRDSFASADFKSQDDATDNEKERPIHSRDDWRKRAVFRGENSNSKASLPISDTDKFDRDDKFEEIDAEEVLVTTEENDSDVQQQSSPLVDDKENAEEEEPLPQSSHNEIVVSDDNASKSADVNDIIEEEDLLSPSSRNEVIISDDNASKSADVNDIVEEENPISQSSHNEVVISDDNASKSANVNDIVEEENPLSQSSHNEVIISGDDDNKLTDSRASSDNLVIHSPDNDSFHDPVV